MSQKISHGRVQEQLDPYFFIDYTLFTGFLRLHTAFALEELFKSFPTDEHRRQFILGIYREEHAAYEDMGRIVEGFIKWRKNKGSFPIQILLEAKPEKVILENIFKREQINSPEDLYSLLELAKWIPDQWNDIYPDINCEKILTRICQFIYTDCKNNQTRYGIKSYNRIKHGLMLVPNAQRYLPQSPDAPGIIIDNPESGTDNPYVLVSVPMSDHVIEERLRVIDFIQSSLRTLTGLYVLLRHPEIVKTTYKLQNIVTFFNNQSLAQVREFLRQLSSRT